MTHFKVRASKTEYMDVDVSLTEAVNIAERIVRDAYDLKSDEYIHEGHIVYDEEFHGSHSWTETHTVRVATPSDIEGLEAIARIHKWRWEQIRKETKK